MWLDWSLIWRRKKKWRSRTRGVSRPVNKASCLFWALLIYILSFGRTHFPVPTDLFSSNQSTSGLPHLLFSWDTAAGSHSFGMNLSRLKHSAKGHYPGLHVCRVAELSNSTRCCCDHRVTCEGMASICRTSRCLLFASTRLARKTPSEEVGYFQDMHKCIRNTALTSFRILFEMD